MPQRESSPLILSVLPVLVLFAGAATLFWLSTQDLARTVQYWEIFVPVVAVLSLFSGWTQVQALESNRLWYLLKQFIHWGGVIAVLYLFNAVGFRDLLNDQQYTVILIGFLSMGTLLAAIQMDYKLIIFAVFLAFCTYVLFLPADNSVLIWTGNLFRITDPGTNPAVVAAAAAGVGFVASLIVRYLIPMRQTRDRGPTATAGEMPNALRITAPTEAAGTDSSAGTDVSTDMGASTGKGATASA